MQQGRGQLLELNDRPRFHYYLSSNGSVRSVEASQSFYEENLREPVSTKGLRLLRNWFIARRPRQLGQVGKCISYLLRISFFFPFFPPSFFRYFCGRCAKEPRETIIIDFKDRSIPQYSPLLILNTTIFILLFQEILWLRYIEETYLQTRSA